MLLSGKRSPFVSDNDLNALAPLRRRSSPCGPYRVDIQEGIKFHHSVRVRAAATEGRSRAYHEKLVDMTLRRRAHYAATPRLAPSATGCKTRAATCGGRPRELFGRLTRAGNGSDPH
jgi:hypothetical protein